MSAEGRTPGEPAASQTGAARLTRFRESRRYWTVSQVAHPAIVIPVAVSVIVFLAALVPVIIDTLGDHRATNAVPYIAHPSDVEELVDSTYRSVRDRDNEQLLALFATPSRDKCSPVGLIERFDETSKETLGETVQRGGRMPDVRLVSEVQSGREGVAQFTDGKTTWSISYLVENGVYRINDIACTDAVPLGKWFAEAKTVLEAVSEDIGAVRLAMDAAVQADSAFTQQTAIHSVRLALTALQRSLSTLAQLPSPPGSELRELWRATRWSGEEMFEVATGSFMRPLTPDVPEALDSFADTLDTFTFELDKRLRAEGAPVG